MNIIDEEIEKIQNLDMDKLDEWILNISKLKEQEHLNSEDIRNVYLKISKIVKEASEKYYEEDQNIIPDFLYDKYMHILSKMEDEFQKDLKKFLKTSITDKIMGKASSKFSQVVHEVIMQSLQDVFSYDEILAFDKRVKESLNLSSEEDLEYVVETKIDGLSSNVLYEKGKLKLASTRGNGEVGEDVTENIYQIESLPKEIKFKNHLLLRGEVLLTKENFLKLNENIKNEKIEAELNKFEKDVLLNDENISNEELNNLKESRKKELEKYFDEDNYSKDAMNFKNQLFLNARNAASGTLRQKDKEIVRKRNLSIFFFNLQKIDLNNSKELKDLEITKSHYASLQYIKSLGFSINPYIKKVSGINEAIKKVEEIEKLRNTLPFGIDGAVIKVDRLDFREKLGITQKYPKWAIAYKYPPEKVETKIKNIEVNVGRTGVLTPLAIFEKPTLVDGSRISKATLHNIQYINLKDIRIGDYVYIQKAGDVIPQVDSVILSKRDENVKKFEMPKICPICSEKLIQEESTIRCTNLECPSRIERGIIHFVSKKAMNIENLGEQIISNLINLSKIEDFTDIYLLKLEDLRELKKIKNKENVGKSVKFEENILNAIEKSKKNNLDRLINGLGILNIGEVSSRDLAKEFKSMDNILKFFYFEKNPKEKILEKLKSMDNIGDVVAKDIYNYFTSEKNIERILKLKSYGLNFNYIEDKKKSEKLKGMVFCITGTLSNSRKYYEDLIKENSGEIQNSITSKVTHLLLGENAGSKLEKAKKQNILIINEEKFNNMIY